MKLFRYLFLIVVEFIKAHKHYSMPPWMSKRIKTTKNFERDDIHTIHSDVQNKTELSYTYWSTVVKHTRTLKHGETQRGEKIETLACYSYSHLNISTTAAAAAAAVAAAAAAAALRTTHRHTHTQHFSDETWMKHPIHTHAYTVLCIVRRSSRLKKRNKKKRRRNNRCAIRYTRHLRQLLESAKETAIWSHASCKPEANNELLKSFVKFSTLLRSQTSF